MAQQSTLLMTMSDVAALARVQRPVVSVWRTRAAGAAHPFPAPVDERRGQSLFDAGQVGQWLVDTQRGNNPHARADAAAHAALGARAQPDAAETFERVRALLALRHSLGRSLRGRSDNELLDAADDLVEDAYTEGTAFERLRDESGSLSALALRLMARTALAATSELDQPMR